MRDGLSAAPLARAAGRTGRKIAVVTLDDAANTVLTCNLCREERMFACHDFEAYWPLLLEEGWIELDPITHYCAECAEPEFSESEFRAACEALASGSHVQ